LKIQAQSGLSAEEAGEKMKEINAARKACDDILTTGAPNHPDAETSEEEEEEDFEQYFGVCTVLGFGQDLLAR
jgi:hypothetical protein